MEHRLGAAAAAAMCVLLGVTACTTAADPGPSTASGPASSAISAPVASSSSVVPSPAASSAASTSTTAATTTTATTTTASASSTRASTPTEIAEAQVEAFVPTYFAALDRLTASLTAPLSEIAEYAVDPVSKDQENAFTQYRAHNWISVGSTRVGSVEVTNVDLKASPPTATVTTCVDVRGVKEIDKSTGAVVTVPTRPDFLAEHLTVVNIDHLSASGWRVSWETNQGATSCRGA